MNLMTSEIPTQHAATESISYATSECILGQVLIAHSVKGVCAVLLGDDRDQLETDLAARFPEADLIANEAILEDDLVKVNLFLEKPAEGLDITLDMRRTLFQRLVWEKLRAIPAGRTVTYNELAQWVGPLTSARAVAGACAANPIALAVPCHRVVRSNGDLAGYRWGIERKRELIKKEALA
jgi:AraC family transcriptional regulator, regulatory protein of adaptative response / methylated-DNA-[protein]-cysteine methyltransferase